MKSLLEMEREVTKRLRKEQELKVNEARKIFPVELIAQVERKAEKDAATRNYQQIRAELIWIVYDLAYEKAVHGTHD